MTTENDQSQFIILIQKPGFLIYVIFKIKNLISALGYALPTIYQNNIVIFSHYQKFPKEHFLISIVAQLHKNGGKGEGLITFYDRYNKIL